MIREIVQTVVFWLLGLERPGAILEATRWQWYAAWPLGTAVLVAVAAAGVAAAAVNFLPRNGIPWKARVAVGAIRIVGFGLLGLLLCQLELRLDVRRSLRPNVAVVTDISGSMGFADVDGRPRLEAARDFLDTALASLESKANAARYALGWKLLPYDESAQPAGITRLVDSLAELAQQERDLQAVVLLTDGNDSTSNEGAAVAPIFAARSVPVYPVIFGNPEARPPDLLRSVAAGDYVRLHDELHLATELVPGNPEEQIVTARLFQEGFDTPLAVQDNIRLGKEPVPIGFVVTPQKAGRFTYRIEIDGLDNSATSHLLKAEHTVDVVDQRIRVLYIDIPRDERKILGHFLARDRVIDLACLTMLPPQGGWHALGTMYHTNKEESPGLPDNEADLYKYDVIILGDIPRSYFLTGDVEEKRMQWIVDFARKRGGGLVTLGGRTVYGAGQYQGSSLASILPFEIKRMEDAQIPGEFRLTPTPLGLSHPIMQLEGDFESNRNAWADMPTLEGCNRVSGVKPTALLLAVRHLTSGPQPVPVIAYQSVGKGRVLALTADTTWRWEMQRDAGDDVAGVPEGTDYFRPFWGSVVRFLAPDPRLNPQRPQIDRRQKEVSVGETVGLTTRLVDEAFNPVRKADLVIRVTSPSGRTIRMYPSDSISKPGVYEYDVVPTEPGTWRVEAIHDEARVVKEIGKAEKALIAAKAGNNKGAVLEATGNLAAAKAAIAVEEIRAGESRAELEDPRARPDVMDEFALATGGRSFLPSQAEELLAELDLTTHEVARSYTVPVWNLPGVMVLFMVLVALDCFIRKRRGLV